MIELLFSTADTELVAGRARVMAAINARAQAVGLGAFFPADQAFPGRAPDVPCSALAPLLPAPLRALLATDTVIIDVSDGMLSRPGPNDENGQPTTVTTGYFMDVQVRLLQNPAHITNLAGVLSGPWAAKADTTRARTAEELAADPGAPANVRYKLDAGVRLQLIPPRARKHRFAGT